MVFVSYLITIVGIIIFIILGFVISFLFCIIRVTPKNGGWWRYVPKGRDLEEKLKMEAGGAMFQPARFSESRSPVPTPWPPCPDWEPLRSSPRRR